MVAPLARARGCRSQTDLAYTPETAHVPVYQPILRGVLAILDERIDMLEAGQNDCLDRRSSPPEASWDNRVGTIVEMLRLSFCPTHLRPDDLRARISEGMVCGGAKSSQCRDPVARFVEEGISTLHDMARAKPVEEVYGETRVVAGNKVCVEVGFALN